MNRKWRLPNSKQLFTAGYPRPSRSWMAAVWKAVISAYETRLAKLEREKFVLAEKEASALPPKGRLEEFIELSLRFLASPWNIYANGDYATRQTVLRLAFVEPLQYNRNQGYRTPEISFPFKVLEGISGEKKQMVL